MKTTRSVKCVEPGCAEYGHFSYDTQRDAREPRTVKYRSEWRCVRHSGMDRMLSPENRVRTKTMEVLEKNGKNYWNGTFGFVSGDGYKAFANDFPVGTKLTITATIELP